MSNADVRRWRSLEKSRDEQDRFQQDGNEIDTLQEGGNLVVENDDGNMLEMEKRNEGIGERIRKKKQEDHPHGLLKRIDEWRRRDESSRLTKDYHRHRRAALVYKCGNT